MTERVDALVRALIAGDVEAGQTAKDKLAAGQALVTIAATMTVMLDRYLRARALDDDGGIEIARMVYDKYAAKDLVPFMAVETMIRGTLGEDQLLESAPREWTVPTQRLISFALGQELMPLGLDIEDVSQEVSRLVVQAGAAGRS